MSNICWYIFFKKIKFMCYKYRPPISKMGFKWCIDIHNVREYFCHHPHKQKLLYLMIFEQASILKKYNRLTLNEQPFSEWWIQFIFLKRHFAGHFLFVGINVQYMFCFQETYVTWSKNFKKMYEIHSLKSLWRFCSILFS